MNVKPLTKAAETEAPILEALVLAAGRGRRFGGDKLLAPWRDGVLLDGALAAAFAARVRRVTLVVGANGGEVAAAAVGWADRNRETAKLAIVESVDWAAGMSASLKAGVAALSDDVKAVYVFLGDMPHIPVEVLAPLAEALAAGAPAAATSYRGVLGHPALIGSALFPALTELDGDRGARAVLERLGDALTRVEAPDDGVLFDVDTPDALVSA